MHVMTEHLEVSRIGFDGQNPGATLGRQQRVDADVGAHVQHHASRLDGVAEKLALILVVELGAMPHIHAAGFADVQVSQPQIPIEIVHAQVQFRLGKHHLIEALKQPHSTQVGQVFGDPSGPQNRFDHKAPLLF